MASPQFLLVCPDSYQRERPRVLVKVAENLDHTFPSDRPRTLKSEGPGKWGFNVPFTLTTNDQDCRPGYYVIHVTVEYHNLANPSLPHAFHCSIRLHITQPGSNEGRTLTIDGDGHADINLRGQDLKSFDQVILKGDERANITLHNNELLQSEETNEETEEESVTHTFELKPTFQDEPRLFIPERYKMVSPSRMEMAMFLFTDESRIMLIPKKRVTIGRNRSAQIVLRFLPRSSQHDRLSLKISRDHMTLELNNDGLLVKDRGPDRQGKQTGALKISGKVVQNGNQHLLGPEQLGGNLVVELPYGLSYEQPFKFELDLFGGEDDEMGHDQARRQQKLDLLQRAVGTQRRPPLWRLAEKNGFDAVRLRRRENLVEEKYVLLYCRGLIGNSPSSNPIHIDDRNISPETARLVYIDRSFWLQNLGPADRVKVDGQPIGPGELIPLSPGMELLFGETAVRFERFEQMHL